MQFGKNLECVIIIGLFNRPEVARKSIESLLKSIESFNTRLIIIDSSKKDKALLEMCSRKQIDFIWTPGDVSMGMARNMGFNYACEKYVFEWVMFIEDDLIYENHWYKTLIDFAKINYAKKSPNGMYYSSFTASYYKKNDKTVIYDEKLDCYSEFFGPRADQRLFKTNHYMTINKNWDRDLLGISSYQTSAQTHRDTMNGYCSANIGHKKLCYPVEGQESTWIGQRDVGPAAFDKRLEGYKSTLERVKQFSLTTTSIKDESTNPFSQTANIKPKTSEPMTMIKYDENIILRNIKKRFNNLIIKLKRLFN